MKAYEPGTVIWHKVRGVHQIIIKTNGIQSENGWGWGYDVFGQKGSGDDDEYDVQKNLVSHSYAIKVGKIKLDLADINSMIAYLQCLNKLANRHGTTGYI